MNKRQDKKFKNRRYEVVEVEDICVHGFSTGDIVLWTGVKARGTKTRVFVRRDGLEQCVPKRYLKRSYKKFK